MGRSCTVTILAFDASMEMSIVMARDLFHAGAVALQHENKTRNGKPEQEVLVASPNGKAVKTFSGSMYQVDCSILDIERTDLIIVSGVLGRY